MSEYFNKLIEEENAKNEAIKNLDSDEINNLAIGIVKDIKLIVETTIRKDIEEAYENLSTQFNEYSSLSYSKSFNLNLFDDDSLYYQQLRSYSNGCIETLLKAAYYLDNIKIKFTSSFNIINFSILTDLLIKILETDKKAYKDSIIKADISILIDILTSKAVRITNSHSLFSCFVNELKCKYKGCDKYIKETEFIKKMNDTFIKEGMEKYKSFKNSIYKHIKNISNKILFNYKNDILSESEKIKNSEKPDYSKFDDISIKKTSFQKFVDDDLIKNEKIYKSDLLILKKKCLEEENKSSFEYYAKVLLEKNLNFDCTEQYLLETSILPFDFINIDINNDENKKIIYNIPKHYSFIPEGKRYYDSIFGQYLEIKKEINYTKRGNYEKEINEILTEEKFIYDLFSILGSNNISSYFKSNIKFLKDNEVEFVKNGDYDICLGDQYDEFMMDMKDNYNKTKKYLVIKQICYKIPAMTDSSMRIFINPILEISENIQKDKNKLKSILKSALFTLLIHEMVHFLKAYPKNNTYPKEYPLTPRNAEKGRCIIFYLFGTGIIKSISYIQSLTINDINSWKNLDKLRNLFEKSKNNNNAKDNDTLDFYLTEEDNNTPFEKKTEYCLW